MKKTLFISLSFLLFAAIPSFAQNTQQKANEINAAGRSAVQSQSATKSRGTQNAAWDGAKKSSGTHNMAGNQIDIIGGDDTTPKEEEKPSTFETPETEDATPWKGIMIGIISSFMGALALMLAASTLLACSITDEVTRSSCMKLRIAQAMYIAAAVSFGAALSLATLLMIQHNQYLLGGIWAGAAILSISAAISMVYKCQAPTRFYDPEQAQRYTVVTDAFEEAFKKAAILGFVISGIGVAAGGGFSVYSYLKADEGNQTQQEDENQESSSAKIESIFYIS